MKNSDLKRFYEPDASNNNEGFARLNENGAVDAPVASNKIDTGNAANGKLMAADGEGGVKFVDDNSGTTVIANPTLAGTEADLTGLQVGETKYKVPAGGGASNYITLMDLVDIDDVISIRPDCLIEFYTSDTTFIDWCESFAQSHGYASGEDKYFELDFYPTCTNYISNSDGSFGGALLSVKFDPSGEMYFDNVINFDINSFTSSNDPVALPGPFYNCFLYRCTDGSAAETGYIKVTENIPELPFEFRSI